MAALDLIRTTYRDGKRKLPAAPPLRFVPRRWRTFVLDQGRVDRAAYELCAFSELRDRLRAGDVWVAGSRRYRAFDDDLLPRPAFEALRSAGPLPLAVAPRFEDHLAERSLRLEEAAAAVATRARAGTLPDIRLDEAGLTITPLRALTPPTVKTVRQALYDRLPRVRVTDVLLSHQSGLAIAEHAVDTGGASDHVFGLMPFFGYRFAPRLRDLKERRLHLPPGVSVDPLLAPLVDPGGPIDVAHATRHWDDLLRVAASIRSGTVSASAMLRKLGAYPRQNGLALALREVGRLERSLFMLNWLRDLDLRRRVQAGLNKGEARNALARAIFFCQLGELRDRTFENQAYRASGLNLIVAAVILWNTRYLARAAADLGVEPDLMRHVAPLGWEHLSLTGDYAWDAEDQPALGELRPLRSKPSLLAA